MSRRARVLAVLAGTLLVDTLIGGLVIALVASILR